MNKKLWSIVSLSLVVVLLLAACGPRAAAPAPTTPTPVPAAPTPAPAIPAPTPAPTPASPSASTEKPKYGGTINLLQPSDLTASATSLYFPTNMLTNEHLIEQDWAKGPGGTNEIAMDGYFADLKFDRGHIAESFEIISNDTWKFKIRRGIHWALDPNNEASRLVNGRELTVDDVIFSAKRWLTTNIFYPAMGKAATVEKIGPWEMTIKAPVDPWWAGIAFVHGWSFRIQPPEVVQKYNVLDWRNTVGEGPFMLTDLVPGSAATLTRNPNYWYKNHANPGKGDQLPYVDTVKLLIVTDPSTQQAALRTGRLDWAINIQSEDARALLRTAPNLKYVKTSVGSNGRGMFMRTDKPELPFKDKRVRQALMLATDFEALKNDLYGGDAFYPISPVAPGKDTEGIYIPLEELPESARSLFKYNPERAKQLLKEAGYPNGFKTKIIVQNASIYLDPVAAVKSMWAKVGVDLEIQPREGAIVTSIVNGRNHEEMILSTAWSGPYAIPTVQGYRGVGSVNPSQLDDPKIEAAKDEMAKHIFIDMPKVFQIGRELIPYLHEQAYYIGLTQPYTYRLWQPWVKNYRGETTLSWSGHSWVRYVWIDQDLKEKTTGRR